MSASAGSIRSASAAGSSTTVYLPGSIAAAFFDRTALSIADVASFDGSTNRNSLNDLDAQPEASERYYLYRILRQVELYRLLAMALGDSDDPGGAARHGREELAEPGALRWEARDEARQHRIGREQQRHAAEEQDEGAGAREVRRDHARGAGGSRGRAARSVNAVISGRTLKRARVRCPSPRLT